MTQSQAVPRASTEDQPGYHDGEEDFEIVSTTPSPADDRGSRCRFVPELFAAMAARTPRATAVTFGSESLSYAELDAAVERCARRMRGRGVMPGDLVAVQLDRSAELMVVLLSVLRVGAGFIPIDPEAAPARRDAVLSRSGAKLFATAGFTVGDAGDAGEDADAVPQRETQASDVMYVLYTSGTTGEPKGVVVEHGGVANLLSWMVREYGFSAQDRLLQKTPYTFDASVWELFVPLISGGTVVFAEPGDHRDPRRLVEAVREHGVTVLQLVPSMLKHVLEVQSFADCRTLRQVFCGGEVLSRDLQERFFDTHPAALHNLYGPTETTIQVLTWTCEPGDERGFVPIGRPVDGVSAYVLDDSLSPVPDGAIGQLHIGGVAVARGYLGEPELTACSFIRDPFSADPAARIYRTGDMVCRHPGGVFEYLGRQDDQVKVNGHRVEIGAIEASLRSFPGVSDAVVLIEDGGENLARLVAYLRTPGIGTAAPRPGDLRGHLADRLPEYMIPRRFYATSRFPYSAHGKLDKTALARQPVRLLGSPQSTGVDAVQAADSEVERTLAEIWRRLLAVDTVGVHDDFFELGGDSMSGLLMIAHAKQQGIVITPSNLFRLRRIRAIADYCAHS